MLPYTHIACQVKIIISVPRSCALLPSCLTTVLYRFSILEMLVLITYIFREDLKFFWLLII
jgi:hypothetical protein